MLPPRARIDLGAMAVNGYSGISKAQALQEALLQIVLCPI